MNSIDDIEIIIENNSELRNNGTVIIYYRTLIMYIMFILVLSGGAFAAGLAWRSIEVEHLFKAQQITAYRHEFAAKNEKPGNSVRIVADSKE